MPKERPKSSKQRHDPLDEQLRADHPEVHLQRKKQKKAARDEEEIEAHVSESMSRRILEQAREMQDEEEGEFPPDELPPVRLDKFAFNADDKDDLADGDDGDDGVSVNEEYETMEITEQDERAMALFLSGSRERVNLADVVASKFAEISNSKEPGAEVANTLPPQVVAVYRDVGRILSTYRSGAVPKPFKIVPSLSNWEDILALTDPPGWTPHAMYVATNLFASNLNSAMAQRFYNLVLLPCVQQNLDEEEALNYHLYRALKKACYKPAAFYKGIVIPLCESRACTLREAAIIASVIKKISLPVLHSAAALLKIAEMDYTGANTIFIHTLLEKKYGLPLRVVDAVVNHFCRFSSDSYGLMPMLWHKALLVFVQRYKNDLEDDQRERLRDLLKKQFHRGITEEITRELNANGKAVRVVYPGGSGSMDMGGGGASSSRGNGASAMET